MSRVQLPDALAPPRDRVPAPRLRAVEIPARAGGVMFGVLAEPASPGGRHRAVVVCHAGVQSKTGTGDVLKWLADCLARGGVAALRFDQGGTGDSGRELPEMPLDDYFSAVHAGLFAGDTQDAVGWMRAQGAEEVFLLGVSSGGLTAMHAAAAGPHRVDGVILLTPPVLSSALRAHLRRAGGLPEMGHRAKAAVLRTFASRRPEARPDHPAFSWPFWTGYRAMVEKQIPMLFVLATLDGDTRHFDDEFREKVLEREPEHADLWTIARIPDADHALMFRAGREHAFAAIDAWLRRRPAR